MPSVTPAPRLDPRVLLLQSRHGGEWLGELFSKPSAPENFVVNDFAPAEGRTLNARLPLHFRVETSTAKTSAHRLDFRKTKVQKFIDLIKAGTRPPWRAAHACHTSLKTMQKDPAAKRLLDSLSLEWEMKEEDRKKARKAALNKILLQNSSSDDPKMLKLVIDAAKEIRADQEGAVLPAGGGDTFFQNIFMSPELRAVTDKVKLPGEQEAVASEEVIDVEVVENEGVRS